jgi:bifunctional non-homologous end joining protein LigD
MGLKDYFKKRRFDKTPEPKGAPKKAKSRKLAFVVHEHQASRHHYDLRLELGGVLKSWAVPKGPSLDPHEHHLAVHTEDHPFEYRKFEGVIPEGNYGAGNVIIWDEGWLEARKGKPEDSEKTLLSEHKKGHLTFILHGHKLKGEFALIKLKNADDPKAWLLIKKGDEYASTEDITKQAESVKSHKKVDELGGKPPDLSSYPQKAKPWAVKPMLASLADEPFSREGWLLEIKWDGYRAIAAKHKDKVALYSRNAQDFAEKYPPVMEAVRALKHDVILDGEIVATDSRGNARFEWLQHWTKEPHGNLQYYAFDILWCDGRDVRTMPLGERKKLLQTVLPKDDTIRYSDHVERDGTKLFKEMQKRGLEGMVAKDSASPYREDARGHEWLKVKTHHRQEVVIGGYTEPRGGRKYLGSLVVGVYQGGQLQYVGHSGGGIPDHQRKALWRKLSRLERKTSPFATEPKPNAPVHWVRPELVCEMSFSEWTADGRMRHPEFEGLREDKKPRQIHREKITVTRRAAPGPSKGVTPPEVEPEKRSGETLGSPDGSPRVNAPLEGPGAARNMNAPSEGGAGAKTPSTDGGAASPSRVNAPSEGPGAAVSLPFEFTHADKVFFPKHKYTKGDMFKYYESVADFILPYLKDRPCSLNRMPNGINGESFYQKNNPHLPDWVPHADIFSESNNENLRWIVGNDLHTLLYMVQLGCIEINPWNSRTGNLEKPDWIVIDLDPEGVSFKGVVQVARTVHNVCDEWGIPAYPKTSGKTGIHVYIPLHAQYNYEQAKDLAHLIALEVNKREPKLTSVERMPEKRKHKIYVDFLQNREGQTLAAPYSLRPTPDATVSMPLHWDEVTPSLKPTDYTIQNALKRLGRTGDLWKPILGKGLDLKATLKKIERYNEQHHKEEP